MAIKVLDFHRDVKEGELPSPFLNSPVYDIRVNINGNKKILKLKLDESIKYPEISEVKGVNYIAYQNYIIISCSLVGAQREIIRDSWGLTEREYREFIFKFYCAFIMRYTTFNFLKKLFLILTNAKRCYEGGVVIC